MIEVELHFEAGEWLGIFSIPYHTWTELGALPNPAPNVLFRVVGFEENMRAHSMTGAFSGERKIMDPGRGLGFTAKDLSAALDVIENSIYYNLRDGFEPL